MGVKGLRDRSELAVAVEFPLVTFDPCRDDPTDLAMVGDGVSGHPSVQATVYRLLGWLEVVGKVVVDTVRFTTIHGLIAMVVLF